MRMSAFLGKANISDAFFSPSPLGPPAMSTNVGSQSRDANDGPAMGRISNCRGVVLCHYQSVQRLP